MYVLCVYKVMCWERKDQLRITNSMVCHSSKEALSFAKFTHWRLTKREHKQNQDDIKNSEKQFFFNLVFHGSKKYLDTIKEVKRWPKEWEKIFCKPCS